MGERESAKKSWDKSLRDFSFAPSSDKDCAVLDNCSIISGFMWATIGRFGMVPPQLRIDSDWLDTLSAKRVTDLRVNLREPDGTPKRCTAHMCRSLGEKNGGIYLDKGSSSGKHQGP